MLLFSEGDLAESRHQKFLQGKLQRERQNTKNLNARSEKLVYLLKALRLEQCT